MRDQNVVPSTTPRGSVVRQVRRGARQLHRVVVELQGVAERFYTFMDRVEGRGTQARLVLSPLPHTGGIVVPHQVTLACVDAAQPWTLHTRCVAAPPGELHVELCSTQLLPYFAPLNHHLRQRHAPLMLVSSAGLGALSPHVFPVLEVGPRHCVIETTELLNPGTVLGPVEVMGDRGTLRHAHAQVSRSTPWRMWDGSRRFHCKLRLTRAGDPTPSAVDLLVDGDEIAGAISRAGMAQAQGDCRTAAGQRAAVRVLGTNEKQLTLALASSHCDGIVPGVRLTLEFDVYSITHLCEVVVERVSGHYIQARLPRVMERRHLARRAQRLMVPSALGLRIIFHNPASGCLEHRDVQDLSYSELSFHVSTPHDVLWEGLPLEQARLVWGFQSVELGDLQVDSLSRSGDERICRASMQHSTIAEDSGMIELMATMAHPDVFVHRGEPFEGMVRLYNRGGLFAPHMQRNMEALSDRMRRTWKRLHQADSGLVRTLLHGSQEQPNGAISAIRAWEHTWLAQHFVVTSPKLSDGVAGKLQLGYLDRVLPRPEGQYVVFFVKSDNRGMNAFYDRFFETTGTPESIGRTTVSLYCRPGDSRCAGGPRDGAVVRPMRWTDEGIVARSAERELGPLTARALSMVQQELSLPALAQRFASIGLRRRRRNRIVSRDGQPLWALLEEVSSPGINLTWMLNATWLVPLHTRFDPNGTALSTALAHLVAGRAQSPTRDVFLNVLEHAPSAPLRRWGFQKLGDVHLYALNRA